MAKIHYKSLSIPVLFDSPSIMISGIENDESNSVEIFVSNGDFSFVLVNGKKYRISGGFAKIDIQKLPSGINDVIFICGTKKLCAEPFSVTNEKIERCPINNDILRNLETMLLTFLVRLLQAEEKIHALEEKTTQKNIFNFE